MDCDYRGVDGETIADRYFHKDFPIVRKNSRWRGLANPAVDGIHFSRSSQKLADSGSSGARASGLLVRSLGLAAVCQPGDPK
jgi:hypothetical protein